MKADATPDVLKYDPDIPISIHNSSVVVRIPRISKGTVTAEAAKRGTAQGRRMQSRNSFLFPSKSKGTKVEMKQRT